MPGPGPSPILPAGPRQTPAGTRTRQARIRDHGMMTRTATVTATRAVTIRVTGTVTVDYEKLDSVTSSHYYDAVSHGHRDGHWHGGGRVDAAILSGTRPESVLS
jgi:hypothetical protein